jgi:2-polyprenyl-3-methyl-5-hydroxy-6-metoxy-1,4-benzoquinol methylase
MSLDANQHSEQHIDQAKSEAFAERMLSILNPGALSLMISIGHKTHLFDAMSRMAPSTSEQIAISAGLNERYVREWLAAMVTGNIIEFDPAQGTYYIPREYAAWLTRSAGVQNMAFQAQYIVMLANVQEQIVDCFSRGGGVPYASFTDFLRLIGEESEQVVDSSLLQTTLPLVPGMVERLQAGIDVADIGCGSGHALNTMAQAFPRSRFTGYDFTQESITAAQAEARQFGLTNTHFEVRDVSHLDIAGGYDFMTAFDSIHDQARPAAVLKAIENALRPGGVFLMLDIRASSLLEENMKHPLGSFFYTVSCNHCMTVSLADNGAGLGTMWGEQVASRMLREAGFTQVEVKHVKANITDSYYIASKSD